MPIQYELKPGTILLCDYSLGGFKPPEMVKRRPVVVVSLRKRKPTGLLTVVPLSTSDPTPVEVHNCQITFGQPLPGFAELSCWAKADMVGTVAFNRLDMFRTARGPDGSRKYLTPRLSDEQLEQLRICLRSVFGF
jgi:mRNA interferase MazF